MVMPAQSEKVGYKKTTDEGTEQLPTRRPSIGYVVINADVKTASNKNNKQTRTQAQTNNCLSSPWGRPESVVREESTCIVTRRPNPVPAWRGDRAPFSARPPRFHCLHRRTPTRSGQSRPGPRTEATGFARVEKLWPVEKHRAACRCLACVYICRLRRLRRPLWITCSPGNLRSTRGRDSVVDCGEAAY